MTTPRRDDDNKLWEVMSALAESVAEAPDEELLEEANELSGEDSAEETRALLLKAVRARRLQAAREEYRRRRAELAEGAGTDLPSTPAARRGLLAAIFNAQPRLQLALTAQHRVFESLTDDEVESYLRQLSSLGALADLPEGE
jgi:hypothetical protein